MEDQPTLDPTVELFGVMYGTLQEPSYDYVGLRTEERAVRRSCLGWTFQLLNRGIWEVDCNIMPSQPPVKQLGISRVVAMIGRLVRLDGGRSPAFARIWT